MCERTARLTDNPNAAIIITPEEHEILTRLIKSAMSSLEFLFYEHEYKALKSFRTKLERQ
jgi:hypothetical protein